MTPCAAPAPAQAAETAADYLLPLGDLLPSALVGAQALAGARLAARRLPAVLGGYVGFECPLGEGSAAADFLVGISGSPAGRRALAVAGTLDDPRTAYAWDRVRDVGRQWRDPYGDLADRVKDVWLEFDTGVGPEAGAGGGFPPSLFLGVTGVGPTSHAGNDPGWLVDVGLPALTGQALDHAAAAALLACIEALPVTGRVYEVGRMLSRAGAPTRLCVCGLDLTGAGRWLSDIGCQTSPLEVLGGTLPRLYSIVDNVDIDIDIDIVPGAAASDASTSTVGPRVGLECYFLPRRQPHEEPRWTALLELLHEEGLCHSETRDSLRQAAGEIVDDGERRWPATQRRASVWPASDRRSVAASKIHHVKVSVCPGQAATAKAYLEVAYGWTRAGYGRLPSDAA